MKKIILLLIVHLVSNEISSQENNIHGLNPIENLLTPSVKEIVSDNIATKPVVFLGESVHYSGSDFLAKAEFVKYLVTEHNYKNIAFESDFFALLFFHSKNNLYKFWSISDQCAALMDFLKQNNVTIWGFDNKPYAWYSQKEFVRKLSDFLLLNAIQPDEKFNQLTDLLIKNGYDSPKILSKQDIDYLKSYIDTLLKNEKIVSDFKWKQILESFKSAVELYTIKDDNNDFKRIAIRDRQMAKNLDFIVNQFSDKKVIVWAANGHISKRNHDYMNQQTMGWQFSELNPGISYHIAFTSLRLPPFRTEKSITKAFRNKNSIVAFLPSTDKNYFVDSGKITANFPDHKKREFDDASIFNFRKKKVDLLIHFDALVFIANGIEVSYETSKPQ